MAFPGASRALLGVLALECLVTQLLAIKALLWAWPSFKYSRVAGLSRDMEETLRQEAPCVAAFRDIYYHGAICFWYVFLAQPCHLRHHGLVLSAKGFCRSGSDLSVVVQDRQAVDVVDLNRVEF